MPTFRETTTKTTWATRTVPPDLEVDWRRPVSPRTGDLLLCEVLRTGIHGRLETADGARSKIYPGDRVVYVVAGRYATSMLEAVAEVGPDSVDMITASGLCGRVVGRSRDVGTPTRLRPLGQAFVGDHPVNLRDFAVPAQVASGPTDATRWVVVVGSSMDSGKTTACVSVIRGLVQAGQRVGAAKITGSASARDFGSFRDAGATPVVDFLDAGWPSTVGLTDVELADLLRSLTGEIQAAGIEWGVVEIADGLLQRETTALLPLVAEYLPGADIVLTVGDALGAVAGVGLIRAASLPVTAISGIVTNSPLASREAQMATGVPTVATSQLGRHLAARAMAVAEGAPRIGATPSP